MAAAAIEIRVNAARVDFIRAAQHFKFQPVYQVCRDNYNINLYEMAAMVLLDSMYYCLHEPLTFSPARQILSILSLTISLVHLLCCS